MLIRYSLLVLILTSFGFVELKAQSDVERADKFFAMNDIEVALNLYQTLLDKQTAEASAVLGMARCYFRLNKYERALHYFKRYASLQPTDSAYLMEYGLTLMGLSLYQEAIEVFERVEGRLAPMALQMKASCQFALDPSPQEMHYKVSLMPLSGIDFDFYPTPIEGQLLFLTVREDKDLSRGPFVDYSKPRIFKAEVGEKVYFSKAFSSNISGEYGPFAFSPSDRRVALTKNNFHTQQRIMEDNLLNMSLHLGKWDDRAGAFVDLYSFPYNEPGVSNGLASFSEDGKSLYFSSNRPGGYGGFDLYKTVFINGRWSTPVNLGPDVNTPGDEISPILRNQKLYFASDYHLGFGGFDVFEASLRGGEWTEVQNLGMPINSSYDEYSYWFDAEGNYGYLTSMRKGGKGGADIYHVKKTTKKVHIHVKDENNNEPIAGVLVDFSSCGEPTFASDKKGNCSFTAFEGFDCHLVVSKVGYTKSSIHVDFNKISGIETQYNVYLKRISQFSSGKIKSDKTNEPLGEAYIEIIDKNSQETQSIYSSWDGSFDVYLEPFSHYSLSIEKEGFQKLTQDFSTAGNIPSSSFQVYYLLEEGEVGNYASGGRGMVSQARGALLASADTLVPQAKSSLDSDRLPLLISKGYAVQLASVATDFINFSYFKPLQDLGRVFVIQEKGISKVRLGVFLTQEEASRVAQRVKSFNDFQDAFVVYQSDDVMGYIESVKAAPSKSSEISKADNTAIPKRPEVKEEVKIKAAQEEVKTKAVQEEAVRSTAKNTKEIPLEPSSTPSEDRLVPEGKIQEPTLESSSDSKEDKLYYIRLAAYLDARYFNPAPIQDMGEIRTFQSGEYTVMLIKGYESLPEARQARFRAVDAGFSNAQIVLYQDNRLIRVE
jgi:hypothetical protein